MKSAVIFGGAGFIGQHFAKYLLEKASFEKVILADLNAEDLHLRCDLNDHLKNGYIEVRKCDVRTLIDLDVIQSIDLICNFAAVHREPGHHIAEYYETNLLGAENVCDWANKVGCLKIIFTSSIAPYGPTEIAKSEQSVPCPVSAYGGSKLAAEKIHEIWQVADVDKRRLVIVRPGVVYGPGEGGNVSRLVKAVLRRYFFYMGNRNTRKAGIYVKELCHAMWWVAEKRSEPLVRFNMSMNPGPTVEEYVSEICKTAGVNRRFINLPFSLIFPLSLVIDPIARIFSIVQPISPVRLRKLVKSNNIVPKTLNDLGYSYRYSFEESMKDWKEEAPHEWK